MRPVIFLDFDGVLNSLRSTLAHKGCGALDFDPVAAKLVGRLATEADANVVVSSAWRIGATVDELRRMLGYYSDALPDRVIDKTPHDGGQRGAQIAQWLANNPDLHNGSFVIIDDDADMLESQLPHFVQTRHRDGFGVPEYLRAMEIIAPNHKDVEQLSWYRATRPLSSELAAAKTDSDAEEMWT